MNILVSDDQPDVREALRLLLKGAGYQTETVDHPKALLRAFDSQEFDLVLMDLNYTRDTTSGDEGLEALTALRNRWQPYSDHRHDGLGKYRPRRRSDAPRRSGFRSEALG